MNKLAGLTVLAAALCANVAMAQRRVDEVVARVNSQIILKSEMDKELRQLTADLKEQDLKGDDFDKKFADESRHLLRNMIDITLFMQVAKEQGIDVETTITKRLYEIMAKNKLADVETLEKAMRDQGLSPDDIKEGWRRDLLAQEVMSREVASRIVVSTDEMRKYYEEHRETFKHDPGIKLGEIGVSKKNGTLEEQRKKIDEAYAALMGGADFGDTAAKYSDTPSAEHGGSVGFIDEADYSGLVPAIAEQLPKLDKGQTSGILDMADGFLILKALDKHTGGILPFDLAQNEIYGALIQVHLQPKVREYLNKLRSEGFVDVREGYTDTGAVAKSERPSQKKDAKKKNAEKSKDSKDQKDAEKDQKGKKI